MKSILLKLLFLIGNPICKKGTYRAVLIFPQHGFALKFPLFRFKFFFTSLWHYRNSWEMLRRYLTDEDCVFHSAQDHVLHGLLDNWREYLFFRKNSSNPFLHPTHFSFLGLCNVSSLGVELPKDMNLWSILCDLTDCRVQKDGHHFSENENFCLYEGHIQMRDYGSKRTQEIIMRHWKEFNSLKSELAER